jgi:hypothetical protein
VPAAAQAGDLPSAIWSPGWTLERIDASHGVMVASRDARRHVALAERLITGGKRAVRHCRRPPWVCSFQLKVVFLQRQSVTKRNT